MNFRNILKVKYYRTAKASHLERISCDCKEIKRRQKNVQETRDLGRKIGWNKYRACRRKELRRNITN